MPRAFSDPLPMQILLTTLCGRALACFRLLVQLARVLYDEASITELYQDRRRACEGLSRLLRFARSDSVEPDRSAQWWPESTCLRAF